MKHLFNKQPHPQPLSKREGSIRPTFRVKLILLLFALTICQSTCLAQKKDTVFHQHLVIKFAPLMYVGTHAAVQAGLETNITQKMTVGFDYAYGNSEMASYQKGGSYYEGEVSQRYRLDLRWYERPFASSKSRGNRFWGVEFFNRTNTYSTPITIGRGSLGGNRYNYYERSSSDATYQVWGVFFKYGNVQTLSERFFLEYYAGIGLTQRSNKIASPSTLGEFDGLQTWNDSGSFNYWTFHSPNNFSRMGGDFLLSIKLNYRIF